MGTRAQPKKIPPPFTFDLSHRLRTGYHYSASSQGWETNAFAAEADAGTGTTAIDLEDRAAGYQATYSKLATAWTPAQDVAAYAGDMRVHVAREFMWLRRAEPGMKSRRRLWGRRRARSSSWRVLGSSLYYMMTRRLILSKRGSIKWNADDLREHFTHDQPRNRNQLWITRLTIIHTCWLNFTNSQTTQHLNPLFLVMLLKMDFRILNIISTNGLLLALPKTEMMLETLMRW